MSRKFLFRSRNQRCRRPGFRPLELELLEARLPPGEAMLGFLLAAAWLEPRIAVVDTDLTPPARSRDSFSRESEMSARAETRSVDTAEQSRSASSNLPTASAQGPIGTLDDDSLWVWPSTIPSVPFKNLDSRDADRIFAAGAMPVGMPAGPGAFAEPSFVPDADARTDRNVRPTLETPTSPDLASGPAATEGHGRQLGQAALSSLGGSTGAALAAAGLGRFGFVSHQHSRPGTSTVTETAAFAPDTLGSRLFAAPGRHGRRPAHFLAAVNPKGSTKPLLLHVHRPNHLNKTGITGSVSPALLLNRKSGHNPAAAVKQVAAFRPQTVGLNPADNTFHGWQTYRVVSLPPNDGSQQMTGNGYGPAAPESMTHNDHSQGSFNFTLTLSGSDSQGTYDLRATGTGRFVSGDASQPHVGTITITSRLLRGGTEVSASTETSSFDPTGSGPLNGFNIDGYITSRYGIDLATATAYSLDASGSVQYSDTDSKTETTHPAAGETETVAINISDNGTDGYHLTVSGTGLARTYAVDLRANSTFRTSDDDTDQLSLPGNTDLEVYHEVDTGSETMTDHAEGTIGADQNPQMTAFRIKDTSTDTTTDTDSDRSHSAGATASDDEMYLESGGGTGTESVTITGGPSNATITLDEGSDGHLSVQDQEQDHMQGALGAGTFREDGQWRDSVGGNLKEALHLVATGHGDDVSFQDVTYTEGGKDVFNTSDTDTEVDTSGSDQSTETQSETARGSDDLSLTVTSPDGNSLTVTQTETITDNSTDGDVGTDTWDDPYQPGDGPVSGTERGRDNFNQLDRGTDMGHITTHGTVDATGAFRVTSFDVDMNGLAGTQGNGSGDDTVTVPGETDRDQYGDNGQATDNYHLRVVNGGGPTSTIDLDETVNGTWGDTDTDTDVWSGPSRTGNDQDTQTDSARATIVGRQSGTVDANGAYSQTNLMSRIDGTDQFGNRDNIDDDQRSQGQDDDVRQQSGVTGSDEYHINRTQTPAGGVTLSDDEGIRETFGISATFTDTGPIQGSGGGHLNGPITANVHQRGRTQNGEFRFDPGNGDDNVNLTGDYNKTTTVTTPTSYQVDLDDKNQIFATPDPATITNEIKDDSLHIGETDSETNGQWSVGNVDYRDTPSVTITTRLPLRHLLYGDRRDPPGSQVSGNATIVVKQSEAETVRGTGRDHVTLGTRKERTEDGNAEASNPAGGFRASTEFHRSELTTHMIDGDEASPQDDNLQDTITSHSENHTTISLVGPSSLADPPDVTEVQRRFRFDSSNDSTGSDTLVNANLQRTGFSGPEQETYVQTTISIGPRGQLTETVTTQTTTRLVLVDQQPSYLQDVTIHTHRDGIDPRTGREIHEDYDGPPRHDEGSRPTDWFDAVSTFAAAVGDKVSGGLTRRIRQGLGYDDVVHYNSRAYRSGEVVGEVINIGVQNLTPCRFVGVARAGVRVLQGIQATAHVLDAGESFQNWDVIGGMDSLLAARASFGSMLKSCFVAGTPLRTPDGAKPVEQFRPGDLILSRNEHDPNGPVEVKTVEEVFVRQSKVVHLHVGGQVIPTTGEHPFWVKDKGWQCARELQAGALLATMEPERWVKVEEVYDTGTWDTVYNLRISEFHTYFVGTAEWGFSVWAHNADYPQALGLRKGHSYPSNINAKHFGSRKEFRTAVAKAKHELHGRRHIQARTEQEALLFSSGGGNAQYLPGISNRGLEKIALEKGFITKHGGGYHAYIQFDRVVGYNSGKATTWIRSELTSKGYHGHPFLQSRLPREARKYFGL